jgi:hypothetical protein
VATAFRQVLKKQRGVPPKALAQALQTLEESALQNMQDFGAQEIFNTLQIMAKQRYKATGPLLLALERRAETISGEFNSQNVANTLWAFDTMGTKPGERMMGQLERRADVISGEFNSQDIANTLCSLCFFFIQFNLSLRFCGSLSCSFPSMDFDDQKSLCQLHQVFISCDMIEGLHANFPVSVQTLKEKLGPSCPAAFIGLPFRCKSAKHCGAWACRWKTNLDAQSLATPLTFGCLTCASMQRAAQGLRQGG